MAAALPAVAAKPWRQPIRSDTLGGLNTWKEALGIRAGMTPLLRNDKAQKTSGHPLDQLVVTVCRSEKVIILRLVVIQLKVRD